jgi:transcriptional/translational regulatory protein YebC/TACO1
MAKHYIQAYAFSHAGTIEDEANSRVEADKIFNKLLKTANQQLGCKGDECARVTMSTAKKNNIRREFANK